MNKISIGEVSKLMGVTPKTIRIWEQQGKIHPERTPNGHRRYDRDEVVRLSAFLGKVKITEESSKSRTIVYARVSSLTKKKIWLVKLNCSKFFARQTDGPTTSFKI